MKLNQQKILLGVTGGIAAYKAADLVRKLKEQGADVQVVMTEGATEFVSPLTFQALSGHPVRTGLFDREAEAAMDHIDLARWPDAILLAPASADSLARLAAGMANDLLTTLCLATGAPLYIAPAMNRLMWANAATQHNMQTLQQRGATVFGPGEGEQACGETGAGRMLESLEITELLAQALQPTALASLQGQHVLITAGPTREALDPVRYISNHSSGKMGFAIAQAAQRAGATVTIVAGPVTLPTPQGCQRIDVETAEEMLHACRANAEQADIFIATAAVADYRAASAAEHKIKKDGSGADMMLQLVCNPDVLATIAEQYPALYTVGFAAETTNVAAYARAKLQRKKLDLICANQVGNGLAFGQDDNQLLLISADDELSLPTASKDQLAKELMAYVAANYTH